MFFSALHFSSVIRNFRKKKVGWYLLPFLNFVLWHDSWHHTDTYTHTHTRRRLGSQYPEWTKSLRLKIQNRSFFSDFMATMQLLFEVTPPKTVWGYGNYIMSVLEWWRFTVIYWKSLSIDSKKQTNHKIYHFFSAFNAFKSVMDCVYSSRYRSCFTTTPKKGCIKIMLLQRFYNASPLLQRFATLLQRFYNASTRLQRFHNASATLRRRRSAL